MSNVGMHLVKRHVRQSSNVRLQNGLLLLPPVEPQHPGNRARRWQRLKLKAITWLLPSLAILLAFGLLLMTEGLR